MWAILTTISFALSIMAVKDRVIGIAGIGLMFVTTAWTGGDGTVVVARAFDSSGATLTQTISANPTFIITGFVIICVQIVIQYQLNEIYGSRDSDESGDLDEAYQY